MVAGSTIGCAGADLAPTVVDTESLPGAAEDLRAQGWQLDMIAGTVENRDVVLTYVFGDEGGRRAALEVVTASGRRVPSITPIFPEANWPERRVRTMFGVTPAGHPRAARLVRHSHWPKGFHPLAPGHEPPPDWPIRNEKGMQLVRVSGEGIHEIPVGPIHAGIIEPGHFRFFADGERVVSLEPRLFYKHRGIQRLARGRTPAEALSLAEVVSGDTAVGHGWAYCSAVESALGIAVSDDALALRGLLLEVERVANHIGDAGAILNDVALGWAHTQCQGLREELLRAMEGSFGHRFLRGVLAVGGVRRGPVDLDGLVSVVREASSVAVDVVGRSVGRAPVIGRLHGTGALSAADARTWHAIGLPARASGLRVDARSTMGAPYSDAFEPATLEGGDAEARLRVRLAEIEVSVALIERFAGPARRAVPVDQDAAETSGTGRGLGSVEGWRGECLHLVDVRDGLVAGWWPRDPSSLNWMLLPLAVRGSVVPDFPVINKSFNLSYAGNDL